MSHYFIKELGYNIWYNLEELQLRWMIKLEKLPDAITQLKNLKILDIMQSLIKTLPKNIQRLKSLKRLNLNFNKNLKKIPEELFELIQLESFLLRDTSLSQIPNSLEKLKNLIILDISHNPLKEIPVVSKLLNLEKFSGQNCGFREFPKNPKNLSQLKELDLSQNNIADIHLDVFLPKLEKLILSGNPLNKNQKLDSFFPMQKLLFNHEQCNSDSKSCKITFVIQVKKYSHFVNFYLFE